MQALTVVEIDRLLGEVGADLRQAETSLRFLAENRDHPYEISPRQRRRLENAAEMVKLATEMARTAAVDEPADA